MVEPPGLGGPASLPPELAELLSAGDEAAATLAWARFLEACPRLVLYTAFRAPNRDHWATDPSWSPDGTQIVFDGGNWGIYTMNADGSNVTIIDPTTDSATDPE